MKKRVLGSALVLVLCLVPTLARGQQGTTDIRGKVVDQQGGVLPGASVTVRNQDTGMFRETVTSGDGTYWVSGVVPGNYEVTVKLEGFKNYARPDVLLEIGKTRTLDVQLEVGSMQELVTVTAELPIVDVTSKEVGGNITNRELVALPSVNRNYIGFVGLLPGIVPNISTESFGADSVSVNGQDDRNNNYLLDGANNNDDMIGQRAGTQARTPIETIQEFQVITNQFDAEFGRTTGAVINAVTKQGTNQLRGSAFTFAQDARLTQKDYFAQEKNLAKPDTRQLQFGVTTGGPIVRDKAHFFGSLEVVRVDRGNTINIPARPEFDTTTTTKDRVVNTMIRFDHQISANHTWGVRWLREQSPQKNQIVGAVTLAAAREESDVDQTVVGTLSSVLGNTKVNTVRLAFTRENVSFANPAFNTNGRRQDLLDPTLAFQTFTDQQSAVAQWRINNAYQFEDTFSWFLPGRRGDHDLKFGVQYQYSTIESADQGNMNGTFSFGRSNGPFDATDPRTYPDRFSIRVPGPSYYLQKIHFASAFAQDRWKMNNRLTVSLGARYDLEILPFSEVDDPFFPDTSKYPVDKNNVSPRVGFSYDVFGDGKTVARGGYGLFFDKTHLELVSAVITSGVYSNSFTATFPAAAVDPGPRNGLMPTDPFLVNGPVVNRALVEELFPPGSRVKNTGNVRWDNPDRRVPYTHQITFGLERQLVANLSVSADYVHSMGRDQFMLLDLNPGSRATTAVTSPLVRINTGFTQGVFVPVNVGQTTYDGLELQIEKRFARSFSTRVSYTLSSARGNTTGSGIPTSGFQLVDSSCIDPAIGLITPSCTGSMHLELNEGPTAFDRRHNFVVSGQVIVPKTRGMTFSWVARAMSGLAMTLTDGNVDPDRNGSQSEPLASGTYSGTGTDSYTVKFDSKRGGGRGPGFFQVDARFGYRLRFGRRSIDLFGEVFNLLNRANFDAPTGNQASTNFLILTALRAGAVPRTGQLGVRFGF